MWELPNDGRENFVNEVLESCKVIFDRSTRPFGIARVHLDAEGNPADVTIEYLNSAMAATADSTPEDLRGRNIYEIWPDGDRTWLDYFYRAAYQGEAVEFETVSVAYRAFQNVAIFPIVEGCCGYELQDITNWMTHSHSAMESVAAGMFFYEARTGLLLLTEPARESCGLDVSYLSVEEFASALFEGEAARRVQAGIEDFPPQCTKMLFEEKLRDGRWLRISLSQAKGASRFATGFLEDITQLKETEASSARRSEIIEGLSAEYFILYDVDLAQDKIEPYLVRNEVAVYFANIIEEGMTYTDWLEDYCANYVAEEHKAEVFAHLNREALRRYAEGAPGAPADLSVVFKRLFGSEEQFVELRVIKTGEGAHGVVLAARNINDEVQKKIDQNEALETALAVAKHANESKTTFLTNISHDLRTPLNSIMGYCDLALAHLDNPGSITSSLEKIRLSSNHLLNLINDILDVNRIESGKMVLSEQAVDLVQLVEDVRDVFAGQAKEKGIAFTVDTSKVSHRHVLSDPLRLKQIMLNTVGNALKYTDAGGSVDLLVSEGAVSPNGAGMYEMVVRDNGCGMSADFLDRVFLPFERDSMGRAPQTEGTGLGMTITKNLVDLLGGTIAVKSKLRAGTQFDILLPLRLNRSKPVEAPGTAGEGDYRSIRFDGLRVLIADDDELSREMMGAILEDFGFAYELVEDGDEAVDAAAESPEGHFDAIVMDMRMPRMEGDVATRAIRALPRADVAQMPIIALTADAFEEMYRRSREAGMTAHATKPLNTKELILLLDRFLHAGDEPRPA